MLADSIRKPAKMDDEQWDNFRYVEATAGRGEAGDPGTDTGRISWNPRRACDPAALPRPT